MIWSHVGPAQAGFASAILLGNREQIARSDQQSFLKTGTAHLLAISGLHVGILASLFLIAYKIGLIRRNWALISTILFVAFYAWLVEFRPPVVRASILLSLFCCGGLIGRTGCEFNILALAGFIVLIINPSDLFHLGPQLSFLAVTTLVVFKEWIFPVANSDPIKRLIRNSRPAHVRMLHGAGRTVKQMLLVSFLVWLFGLPVVAMHFHLVTPVACIVNPLVMIPISLALFSGLGVCLLSWWLPGSGWVLGGINSISLAFVSDTIAWAESLEWGHWWTAGPWAGSLVLFYVVLLGLLVAAPKRKHEFAFCWVLVWILTGWMFLFQAEKFWKRNFQTEGQVTFADVGHGSCVLLEMPHGRTMLYDAGSLSSPAFATQVISNLLWSNQLEHIDALVISHADLDHFNAIPDLIERFSVGTLYVSVPMLVKESESLERLFELLDEKQIPVRTLAWSDRVELEGGAKLEIVLPPEFGTDDSDNSDSIVISVDVNDQKLLLPGDLEGNGMHLLLQSKPVDYDVVMMPHHGSKNSRPIEFIHWCNPDSAVISCSKNKLNQRVAKDVRQMDCQLFSTAESGSIRMRMNQSGIQVEHYANSQWNEMSELR